MTNIPSNDALGGLFLQARRVNYKKRQIILYPEDTPSDVLYIEEGYVRVYSLTEWGEERLTAIFQRSELFPLLYMFDKIPLANYYEAMNSVVVRKMPIAEFIPLVSASTVLLQQLVRKTAGLLDIYRNRIDNLEYTNAHARLVSRLLCLAQRFGEKRGNAVLIRAPLTHKDIASSIAMTRETTSREFEKLEKNGTVRYVNKLILIPDISRLEKELSAHFDKQL